MVEVEFAKLIITPSSGNKTNHRSSDLLKFAYYEIEKLSLSPTSPNSKSLSFVRISIQFYWIHPTNHHIQSKDRSIAVLEPSIQRLIHAQQVFDEMPVKNVASWKFDWLQNGEWGIQWRASLLINGGLGAFQSGKINHGLVH